MTHGRACARGCGTNARRVGRGWVLLRRRGGHVAPDGSLYVAALAQAPPWQFQDGRRRASRVKGSLVASAGLVTEASGTLSTPPGEVTVPDGQETFAGASDAALLKLAP